METIGTAISVTTVIGLSTKVTMLCTQYASAVENASPDIQRLQGEINKLQIALEDKQQSQISSNNSTLRTSPLLHESLSGCSSQLKGLEAKLEKELNPGPARKMMIQFRLRNLKWPIKREEVDDIIKILERYRNTLSAAPTARSPESERVDFQMYVTEFSLGRL
jgi:hypothetical protein